MALEDESQQRHPNRIMTLEDAQSIHILLPEIVIEILLRLPVKSILRCKCVCKSWCSLISDPGFVKYHLSLSNSNHDYAHHLLMTFTGRTSVNWCPLHDVINDKSTKALKFDFPLKHPEIVGSCNGLVCISLDVFEEIIFIWNPSTFRWIRLPDSGCKASFFPVYGFGYDESSDDYKFVLIACNVDDDANSDTRVMIYSLKSRNWKRIGDFPNGIPVRSPGEFFNGALHWIGTPDLGKSSSWTIFSLDLATETYVENLQPVYDGGEYLLTVKALGEWLCLVCKYLRTQKTDVWLTKVHGVNAFWTKLAFIQNLTDPLEDQFHGPLIIVNDEKMLLHCGQKLVLYDFKNGASSGMKNHDGVLAAWIVVESLVSPDALEIVDK